jgi:hypothetical protein
VPPVHRLRRAEASIGKVFGSVSSQQPDIKRTKLHCGTLSAAKRCTKSPDVVSPLMRRTISEFDGGHVSKVHALPAGLNGTDGGDIEPSRLRPACNISGLSRFWLMVSYTFFANSKTRTLSCGQSTIDCTRQYCHDTRTDVTYTDVTLSARLQTLDTFSSIRVVSTLHKL